MNKDTKISFCDAIEYPKELSGSWIHITFFDHGLSVSGIGSVYFNDKFPSGTVTVGNHLFSEYPDMYGTWKSTDSDILLSERQYVSPYLRNKGKGSIALKFVKDVLLHYGKELSYVSSGYELGNALWNSAFNEMFETLESESNKIYNSEELFEQPVHPNIFFYKRKINK